MAGQVKVGAGLFAGYRWTGSTMKYHRSQFRKALKFRESARADEDALIGWLATESRTCLVRWVSGTI